MRSIATFGMRHLRRHFDSLASIGIRIAAVGFGFLVTIAVGRSLGAEAVGQYGIITQTGMFLSILCVGGLDLSVIRSFSEARAGNDRPATASFLTVSALLVGLMALVGAGLLLSRDLLDEQLLSAANSTVALAVIVAILFARGFTRFTSSFLRSQGEYIFSQIVEGPLIPAIVILAILAGFASDLERVLIATGIAGLFACILGFVGSMRNTSGGGRQIALRPLVKRAVPLWGVAVSKNLSDWYSLAVVAALLSLYDAGVFRVAMQVASALPIITIGIFSVYSPKFGVAHAREDYAEIAKLARTATVLSTVLVVPAALLGVILARPLLSVFGAEFVGGAFVLQVLLVGQTLYVCTGPSGLVLAMTGNERVNLLLTVISLVALLVALPVAADQFGLMGVVVAMSVVLVVRNVVSLVAVRRLTGVAILSGRYIAPPAR